MLGGGNATLIRRVWLFNHNVPRSQVYETHEDNLITEGVLIFGSGIRLRVVVRIRVPGTGYAISIPVEVSRIQVLCRAFDHLSYRGLRMKPVR